MEMAFSQAVSLLGSYHDLKVNIVLDSDDSLIDLDDLLDLDDLITIDI